MGNTLGKMPLFIEAICIFYSQASRLDHSPPLHRRAFLSLDCYSSYRVPCCLFFQSPSTSSPLLVDNGHVYPVASHSRLVRLVRRVVSRASWPMCLRAASTLRLPACIRAHVRVCLLYACVSASVGAVLCLLTNDVHKCSLLAIPILIHHTGSTEPILCETCMLLLRRIYECKFAIHPATGGLKSRRMRPTGAAGIQRYRYTRRYGGGIERPICRYSDTQIPTMHVCLTKSLMEPWKRPLGGWLRAKRRPTKAGDVSALYVTSIVHLSYSTFFVFFLHTRRMKSCPQQRR